MPFNEEVVLAAPSPIVPMRHARSTVLLSSLAVLRDEGRFDEYVRHLPPAHKELLLGAVAGTWIPLDVALSHYRACDALAIPPDQQVANGRAVFDKTGGTLLGTMLRMAREAGVTPWSVFPRFQRFWERAYDGGGVSIVKTGPKEAHLDLAGVALLESRYYRHSLRGVITAVIELFARKAYLTERGAYVRDSITFRMQWA